MRSFNPDRVEEWVIDMSPEDECNLLESFDEDINLLFAGRTDEAILVKAMLHNVNADQVRRAGMFRGRDYRFLGALADQQLQTEGFGLLMHTYARVKLGLNLSVAVQAVRELIRLQDLHNVLKRKYQPYPQLMANLERVIGNANEEAIETHRETIQKFQAHVNQAYSRLERR